MRYLKISGALVAAVALFAAHANAQEASQSDAAQSATPGKKAVRSQNRQTERAVLHALTRTKGLNATGILVVARGGAVTLDGSVPDGSQIQLAQNTAQGVAGAKTVKNNLTVKEPGN